MPQRQVRAKSLLAVGWGCRAALTAQKLLRFVDLGRLECQVVPQGATVSSSPTEAQPMPELLGPSASCLQILVISCCFCFIHDLGRPAAASTGELLSAQVAQSLHEQRHP
jgi:hypothetical protein